MGYSNIKQLATFTQRTIEAIKKDLPDFILKKLEVMEQHLAAYNKLSKNKRTAEGELYRFRRDHQEIINRYYAMIRVCFTLATASGKDTKYLYFKNSCPSTLVKRVEDLQEWVNEVQDLMEKPEHNLLEQYRGELRMLKEELDQLMTGRYLSKTDRTDSITAKRNAGKLLKKSYQTLKLYLNGWLNDNNRDHRHYFKELRLTPKPKKVECLQLETPEHPAP